MNLLTKVSTLMSTDLVTVTVHTPLGEAGALFSKHNIHHLPVTNPEGKLEGIISKSDFLKILKLNLDMPTVKDIMTPHLAKLEPGDTIRTAASLFTLNKFHALPVVENGKIVGMLTTLDLIRLMDREETQLGDYK